MEFLDGVTVRKYMNIDDSFVYEVKKCIQKICRRILGRMGGRKSEKVF